MKGTCITFFKVKKINKQVCAKFYEGSSYKMFRKSSFMLEKLIKIDEISFMTTLICVGNNKKSCYDEMQDFLRI